MGNFVNVLAGLALALVICGVQSARAARTFTVASIKGSYAYANNTEGVGSFGPMSFDGRGQVTLALTANLPCAKPSPSCKRTIADITGVGTYTVNSDGTGVAKFALKESGKPIGTEQYDFVITGTITVGTKILATRIFAADQSGGLAGQLVAPTWGLVSG
jgi:hypothetical protein